MAQRYKPRNERFTRSPPGIRRNYLFKLEAETLGSEAFATLGGAEIRLLLGFYRRREWDKKKRRFTNLRQIFYTIDSMQYEANISRAHAIRCRNILIQKGFIDLIRQVDPQRPGEQMMQNSYGISNRFLKWHPDERQRKINGFKEHPPLKKKDAPSTAFKRKAPQFKVAAGSSE